MAVKVNNLVIKLETNVLAPNGFLDQSVFDQVAFQVFMAQRLGVKVAIVSSGGILAGKELAKERDVNVASLDPKNIAGIGAASLLDKWNLAFQKYKRLIGQVWISHANLANPEEQKSIVQAIKQYQENKIITIANANDIVCGEETDSYITGFSENDKLAAILAKKISADGIMFFTHAGGVFERNPNKGDPMQYEELDVATANDIILKSEGTTEHGTGGIGPKLDAAIECYQNQMQVAITGVEEDAIAKFIRGEPIGTRMGKSVRFWK